MDRREFFGSATQTAAGVWVAGQATSALGYVANETINIGCIGVGGRCTYLLRALMRIANVRVSAVCDVWDVNLEAAKTKVHPNAAAFKDYRKLLEQKDIDAVLIATPDHWHCPITIAACQAGKDVYVEKPLTHHMEEGPGVIDAKNKSGRIVQVGTQQRSMPQYQEAREIVKKAGIGKAIKAHMTWNRNQPGRKFNPDKVDPKSVDWKTFLGSAPEQPFDPYRFRNWRWFWDFAGGVFTDLMVHQLDIVNWILDLPTPATAMSIGDHFDAKGVWQTPDTVQTLLHYPDKLQAYFEGTFSNARNAAMIEIMGTDATLYLDRGRFEILPEGSRGASREKIIGVGKRGADFYLQPDGELLHLSNWLDCIRSRSEPVAPVEAGVLAASAAHLANRSLREGTAARG